MRVAEIFFTVYKAVVPNQRSPGQKLIALALDEELLASLDAARGTMNRSQFIREALVEKVAEGITLREGISAPPDRAGKGGRPAKKQNRKADNA